MFKGIGGFMKPRYHRQHRARFQIFKYPNRMSVITLIRCELRVTRYSKSASCEFNLQKLRLASYELNFKIAS